MFFLNKGKKEQEVLQRQDLRPMMETESMNMQVPHLSTGITWSCVAYGWRRQWHPTPVLLPGKSHGWRSLGGFSPWGRWGSDTTERLHFHFSLWCIGEGHGNPLQCSCLENPRDGGAWWAAVYGVAQSRTRLKRLSGSSSVAYGNNWLDSNFHCLPSLFCLISPHLYQYFLSTPLKLLVLKILSLGQLLGAPKPLSNPWLP